MEEKKFDLNSIIGFLLIGAILLFMMWQNAPTQEEVDAGPEAFSRRQLSGMGAARRWPLRASESRQRKGDFGAADLAQENSIVGLIQANSITPIC